jgi:hypothetical protein
LVLWSGFKARVVMESDFSFGADDGQDYKVREALERMECRISRGDPYDEGC